MIYDDNTYILIWLAISVVYLIIRTIRGIIGLCAGEKIPWYNTALCSVSWTLLFVWFITG